jgi:hypothetical protein
VEIAGDEMYFEAISRTGKTVDSGMLRRQSKSGQSSARVGQTVANVHALADDRLEVHHAR